MKFAWTFSYLGASDSGSLSNTKWRLHLNLWLLLINHW